MGSGADGARGGGGVNGPEHYRQGEERMRTSDLQRNQGYMEGAMHEAAIAQAHFLAALVALHAADKAQGSVAWQEVIGP